MFDWFQKRYVIMLQLDSGKEATLVSSKEGYANVRIDEASEDLYRNNKVQLTIPTLRTYFGAMRRSLQYSNMGIFNCITKM